MNKEESARKLILKSLEERSSLKQDVYQTAIKVFKELKINLRKIANDLKKEAKRIDERIVIEYKEKGEFEAELKFGGDVLIFFFHTNVFNFDTSHVIYKSSYIQQDSSRSYCGIITIYNFLADSFKYNRVDDLGYMIGRIFINKEKHFFVEGKRQLGFLYTDFVNSVFDTNAIISVIESAILYTLDFDLLTPHYNDVKEVTVKELQDATKMMIPRTGKRIGFTFQADQDTIE